VGKHKKKDRSCRRCSSDINDTPYRSRYCDPCRREVISEKIARGRKTTKEWYSRNRDAVNSKRRSFRKDHPEIFAEADRNRLRNRHPLYGIWLGIKSRCYNKKVPQYPRYGGRGITMCNRWRDSFDAFVTDLPDRPSPEHSIERVDNNGNYEPGNCEWSTPTQQANNRRSNSKYRISISEESLIYNLDGNLITIKEFSDLVGLPLIVVKYRYAKNWDAEWILNAKYDCRVIEYRGHRYQMIELSLISGLPPYKLSSRIKQLGWSVDRAMNTP